MPLPPPPIPAKAAGIHPYCPPPYGVEGFSNRETPYTDQLSTGLKSQNFVANGKPETSLLHWMSEPTASYPGPEGEGIPITVIIVQVGIVGGVSHRVVPAGIHSTPLAAAVNADCQPADWPAEPPSGVT